VRPAPFDEGDEEEESSMKKLAFVMAASLLVAITVAAAAKADPGGPNGANLQAHFYDCTGPTGTPPGFDAGRQQIGTAWHLTDSTQIFEMMMAFDETTSTQVFVTAGFERNAVSAVTCRWLAPITRHTIRATGVLTPATGG
jgi:hypothetical protein